MNVIIFTYWLLIALIIYVYFGYPLLVWLLKLFIRKDVKKADIHPFVTVITAAYNEAEHIEATIRNKFSQSYPSAQLEYIVVSDASEDETDAIVKRLQGEHKNLTFIRQEIRQGKTAALNRAVEYVHSTRDEGRATKEDHILIFADANSIYKKDAIKNLVRNFADPTVGYVTGQMVYVTDEGVAVSEGCNMYMKYENKLREWETRISSIVGVDGGIDAIRKELYTAMDAADLPDFILPLTVIEKGFRVIYEPAALLQEETLKAHAAEFNMRVRVALRTYYGLMRKIGLLNILRFGLFSWQLLSHKVLRYMIGFFQLLILILNIFLLPYGYLYQLLLVGQALFYLFALLGWIYQNRLPSPKVFLVPYYCCLLNNAAVLAFLRFIVGSKQMLWSPREG